MNANQFQCYHCKGVFNKAWSDEEAQAESKELFGQVANEHSLVICDDCFQKIHPAEHPDQLAAYKAAKN